MSGLLNQGKVLDRLRANFKEAGIEVSDDDLVGMATNDFLTKVLICEAIFDRTSPDLLPEHLGARCE